MAHREEPSIGIVARRAVAESQKKIRVRMGGCAPNGNAVRVSPPRRPPVQKLGARNASGLAPLGAVVGLSLYSFSYFGFLIITAVWDGTARNGTIRKDVFASLKRAIFQWAILVEKMLYRNLNHYTSRSIGKI